MKSLLLISVIVFSGMLISCKQGYDPAKQITQLNTADTFLFEFPKRNGAFDSFQYKSNLSYEKALGLQSLENGFDSIQIRLFYGGSMVGERLVVLTNKDKNWSAEISKIIFDYNPNFKGNEEERANADYWEAYIAVRTNEFKTPKSGWESFIKRLFKLNILTLPNQLNIEGFIEDDATDGVGVSVQVATKNVYRLYGYGNPDMYLEKHPESKNISEIVKLIDEEFSLKQLWDYTNEVIPQHVPDSIRKVKIQEIQLQDVKPEKKKKKK